MKIARDAAENRSKRAQETEAQLRCELQQKEDELASMNKALEDSETKAKRAQETEGQLKQDLHQKEGEGGKRFCTQNERRQ